MTKKELAKKLNVASYHVDDYAWEVSSDAVLKLVNETEQLHKPVVSGSCDHKEVISVRHAYKCSKCGELLV